MLGIWSLGVVLTGTSFADHFVLVQIVFQFVFLCGVLFGCYRLPQRVRDVRNGFQSIRYGAYALIVWYLVAILDLFLHECQLNAAYGYIMVYIFINLCKFTADVFLLAGIHRVTTCLISQRLEKPLKWIYIGEFLIIMIVITALYYIGSYFADEVLWLNVADPDIIDDVSSRKDKFEAAFFILQWVLTLFIFIIITVALFTEDGETISSGSYAIMAAAFLWIRSSSELIIVVHYHLLQYPPISGIDAARDFVYGFCSSAFLVLVAFVADDPACRERRDPVRQLVEEDIRTHIITTIRGTVDTSGLPPVLADVLSNVRQNPVSALSANTMYRLDGRGPNAMVMEYVNKVQERWGDLQPEDISREN